MRKYFRQLIILSALALTPLPVLAQVSGDPCGMPAQKQTFQATISSATTTKLISGQAGRSIHLCGLKVENVGTSGTWQFKIGTKTSAECDTGTLAMTPAFGGTNAAVGTAGNGNTVLGYGPGEILDTAVPGADLCLVSGGTITNIWVFGSYV